MYKTPEQKLFEAVLLQAINDAYGKFVRGVPLKDQYEIYKSRMLRRIKNGKPVGNDFSKRKNSYNVILARNQFNSGEITIRTVCELAGFEWGFVKRIMDKNLKELYEYEDELIKLESQKQGEKNV